MWALPVKNYWICGFHTKYIQLLTQVCHRSFIDLYIYTYTGRYTYSHLTTIHICIHLHIHVLTQSCVCTCAHRYSWVCIEPEQHQHVNKWQSNWIVRDTCNIPMIRICEIDIVRQIRKTFTNVHTHIGIRKHSKLVQVRNLYSTFWV